MEWNIESVDMKEVIHTAANIMRGMVQEKGLTLQVNMPEELPPLNAEKDKFVQVFINLISNAVKFTDEGQITINLECSEEQFSVYISDTGIGIAPENQESIFEKFHQIGNILTEKPPGTGLGLSICREIINHYGGRIWVESELGVGSTFHFTLPFPADNLAYS